MEIESNFTKVELPQENSFKVFLDIEIFTGKTLLRKADKKTFDMSCVIAYNPEALNRIRKETGNLIGIVTTNMEENK